MYLGSHQLLSLIILLTLFQMPFYFFKGLSFLIKKSQRLTQPLVFESIIRIGLILKSLLLFSYLGFLSQIFTIHRIAMEEAGY